MTPEEILKEKERLKLQEEEEQLMLAQELMGKYSLRLYTFKKTVHTLKSVHVQVCNKFSFYSLSVSEFKA